jgi:hypothetical protein
LIAKVCFPRNEILYLLFPARIQSGWLRYREKSFTKDGIEGGIGKMLHIDMLLTATSSSHLRLILLGLDATSCGQCIILLKRLAQIERRTVICTIHQPSALLLEMFDSLYVVANGYCIYRGPVRSLLPHLASIGANCPPYHNPADFRK